MYHSLLNRLFFYTNKYFKAKAVPVVDNYVSKIGVYKFLNRRIDESTEIRLKAFNSTLEQQLSKNDKIKQRLKAVEGLYECGQIDSGSYYTEKAKIETVEKMKTIGEIDYYLDDEESKLNNQLRTASHIGNNLVKSADEFNETTKSEINKKYIYSNFYREHKSNLPDRKIF